jgi:heme/copper-type cytochrome/quinol oxidase subunit 2
MSDLFHSDLLNFGTIIIVVMVTGGVLVALTMVAQSVWSIRRSRADQQDEQLEPKPNKPEGKHHVLKSA